MSTSYNDGTGGVVAQRTDLKLANSDQPGSQLVTAVFDGENFLSWSKSIRFALGAKNKLGFISGKLPQPTDDPEEADKWMRSDSMVRCWILNSMKESISSSFMNWSKAIRFELGAKSKLGLILGTLRIPLGNRRSSGSNPLGNNPYVIVSADQPGVHLITPIFGGSSYGKWRNAVRLSLSAKNKRCPANDDHLADLWERCNSLVMAWLIVERCYELIGISAEFLVYFPAHKMFVKMSPWSNEVVDSICGLPFVLACFMKSSTDSFVCMAENWVFDPGGLRLQN